MLLLIALLSGPARAADSVTVLEALARAEAGPITVEGYAWEVVPYCPPCPEDAVCEACMEPYQAVSIVPQHAPEERAISPNLMVRPADPRAPRPAAERMVRVTGDLVVTGGARWMENAVVAAAPGDRRAETVTVAPGGQARTPSGLVITFDAHPVIEPHGPPEGAYTIRIDPGDGPQELSFRATALRREWALDGFRLAVRAADGGARFDVLPGLATLTEAQLLEIVRYQAASVGIERSRSTAATEHGVYTATFTDAEGHVSGQVHVGTLTGWLYE